MINKTTNLLFLTVACIAPIFIGALHTMVHFSDLVRPEIKKFLQKEFVILGEAQSLWNTWGIVSFMMGASFIVIGLLNSSILSNKKATEPLPIFAILAMIVYQLCVTYVGYEFEQAFQFYGGMIGGILMVICFVLTLYLKKAKI